VPETFDFKTREGWKMDLVNKLILGIGIITTVITIVMVVVIPIRQKMKTIFYLEKELTGRVEAIKSGDCLSVQDATILEKDLNTLLNLFEENYKVRKDSDLESQILKWNFVRFQVQSYLKKEITFRELKILI
jgi:hypothetical protein